MRKNVKPGIVSIDASVARSITDRVSSALRQRGHDALLAQANVPGGMARVLLPGETPLHSGKGTVLSFRPKKG